MTKDNREKKPENQVADVKGGLFDLLIHDLGGPLSVASTSTENLLHKAERYGPLTDQQKRIIERILRNVHKAQALLNEMIEIFRSEERLFQKERFSIERVLRESILEVLEVSAPDVAEKLSLTKSQEEFRRNLEDHGICIQIEGKYCQSSFCHDQKKIKQILRNLLSNALKYRRKRINASVGGDLDLLVSIEDDGLGISPGEQEMIFERFVRLNDKKNTGVPGLGLGLPGVRALVVAMGGKITLESREGLGTCFTVSIPPLKLTEGE
jgi:signal transduction histidine kinase